MAKQHIEEKQQDINELMQVRRDKMQAFIDKGIEPFGRSYDVTHHAQELLDQFETLGEETVVRVAGRLMAVRGHGKASFIVVSDLSGKIQAYFRLDNLGEEKYGEFKLLDIGDIIGVEGTLFKTHRGEITIKVSDFSILAKSLRPLPEKFHGLKDVETRYRQRYLDLIVNPDVRQTFITRTKIIKSIRNYLDSRNFLEVETPVLSPIAGGANARPFITHHNALDIDMYLRIATELYLKRLVVGGFERVYEIGRIFRNEGIDVRHNPEFTSIEVYQAYADFNELMDLAEGIIKQAAMDACGTTTITYEGTEIDLSNFRRVTMNDIVLETTGKDFSKVQTLEEAQAIAQELAVPCEGKHSIGEILYEVFDEKVESTLIQPTIVTQYPTEVSPLSKRNKENTAFTDRFEMFIYGRELANAFSELNDPIDQEQRFIDQQKAREGGDDEAHMMDHDYITALEYGLPPTCGLGIGIDRLVMFLTDSSSIRDVLLFPTMKPLGSEKQENKVSKNITTKNCDQIATESEKIDFSNVKIEPLFEEMVDFDTFSKSDFRAVKVKECVAVPKSKKLLQFTLDDGTGVDRTILSGIHAYYEPEELVGKTLIAITNLPPRAMMGIESCGMLLSAVNSLKDSEDEELHLIMVDNHIPAGAKLY